MERAGQELPYEVQQRAYTRHATERWVDAVSRGVASAEDPKTLGRWASEVGISRSALITVCKGIGISPRDSRDFMRLLRTFVLTGGKVSERYDVLDIAEPETASKLFQRAGLPHAVAMSPLEFLDRQCLVRNQHALHTLKSFIPQLSESPVMK